MVWRSHDCDQCSLRVLRKPHFWAKPRAWPWRFSPQRSRNNFFALGLTYEPARIPQGFRRGWVVSVVWRVWTVWELGTRRLPQASNFASGRIAGAELRLT